MEVMADKVHKQGKHNYLHFTQPSIPYISSSDTLVGTISIFTATYIRDGCVKCSNVVNCALLVCVLCQPVLSFSHPYIC